MIYVGMSMWVFSHNHHNAAQSDSRRVHRIFMAFLERLINSRIVLSDSCHLALLECTIRFISVHSCDSCFFCLQEMFEHDLFQYNDTIYQVDYRPIGEDVSLEQNAFQTAEFKPNGKVNLDTEHCCGVPNQENNLFTDTLGTYTPIRLDFSVCKNIWGINIKITFLNVFSRLFMYV